MWKKLKNTVLIKPRCIAVSSSLIGKCLDSKLFEHFKPNSSSPPNHHVISKHNDLNMSLPNLFEASFIHLRNSDSQDLRRVWRSILSAWFFLFNRPWVYLVVIKVSDVSSVCFEMQQVSSPFRSFADRITFFKPVMKILWNSGKWDKHSCWHKWKCQECHMKSC